MTPDPRVARLSHRPMEWIECVLCIGIVAFVIRAAFYFHHNGYLPIPFFHDTTDTLMDWFNTAYYAQNGGEYDVWRSVYPPLSFVFLKIVSIKSCYGFDASVARDCDWLGRATIMTLFLINAFLVAQALRRRGGVSVWPRTIAMALGMPMLFALERGNLILLTFAAFVLAESEILSSVWIRGFAKAFAINSKPYLLITALGDIIRGRWMRLEIVGLATAGLYLVTYLLIGAGDPITVAKDIFVFGFQWADDKNYLDAASFSPSYSDILGLLQTPFPMMNFVGSRVLEAFELWIPLLIHLGELLVVLSLAGAVLRPRSVSPWRVMSLVFTLLLTATDPGGYVEIFLIFSIFMDRDRGVFFGVALVATYLLCFPFDLAAFKISHELQMSWLSDRLVGHDLTVSLGELVRPGLLLLVEYALALTTLLALGREWASIGFTSTSRRRFGAIPTAPAQS